MMTRSQFIKVRVNRDEHRNIQKRADVLGLTLSEYVRSTVTTVHEKFDVVEALQGLRVQCASLLTAASQPKANSATSELDTHITEAVLLLRELAAGRDAQILSRVRAQLAARAISAAKAGSPS